MLKLLVVILGVSFISLIDARPQDQLSKSRVPEKYAPMPYENYWKVEDPPSNNYYGQREIGNELGRVEGSYYVLLPDGRLMTVTYYVEGDSGFVSKISFQKDAKPFGGR